MNKFLVTLVNIYKIEELRNRIGVTLTILLIYRFGAQITLPGIDAVQLAELSNRTGGGGLLGVLNMFTGGICKCICICFRNNALHFCFYCGTVDGSCDSLSSKTTKRRREWS